MAESATVTVTATAPAAVGEGDEVGHGLSAAEIEALARPEPPSKRYYAAQRYATDLRGNQGWDQLVLQHSNNLCVVCVAPSHALVRRHAEDPVVAISFQQDGKVDRLKNHPSGKKKRKSQWLNELSVLCSATTASGKEYTLYSCIRGSLYEVNARLVTQPQLLGSQNPTDGFVAIVCPKSNENSVVLQSLLTEEAYLAAVAKREAAEEGAEDTGHDSGGTSTAAVGAIMDTATDAPDTATTATVGDVQAAPVDGTAAATTMS